VNRLRQLIGLIAYKPGTWCLVFLFQLGNEAGRYPQAFLVREIFDSLTGDAQLSAAYDLGIGALLLLLVVANLLRYFSIFCMRLSEYAFSYTIQFLIKRNIFHWLLKSPIASRTQALPSSPGEAINRIDADGEGLVAPLRAWRGLIVQLIPGVFAFAFMYSLHPFISLIVVLPFLAITALIPLVEARLKRYREAHRMSAGLLSGFVGELFSSVQAVQVAGAEHRSADHFSRLADERRQNALRETVFYRILDAWSWHLHSLSTGVILILAGGAMRAGDFSVGDFALFSTYTGILMSLVGSVSTALVSHRTAAVSQQRLQDLIGPIQPALIHAPLYLDTEPPTISAPPKTVTDDLSELKVVGLSCQYANGHGITDIDLRIERNAFVVITGRMGAGKTTLLHALLGLIPHDAGAIYWNDEPIAQPEFFFVPPRCAFTPQLPALFSETLRENILLGLEEDQVDLEGAIRAAALEGDVALLQDGLDTVVGSRGQRLSGGQQQRVAAARMFVRHSELFVFDDLSSALDVETEEVLWQRLVARRKSGDITCLAVSHRRPVLQWADHIIVLVDGGVEDSGTLHELLVRCKEMRRLWHGEIE